MSLSCCFNWDTNDLDGVILSCERGKELMSLAVYQHDQHDHCTCAHLAHDDRGGVHDAAVAVRALQALHGQPSAHLPSSTTS